MSHKFAKKKNRTLSRKSFSRRKSLRNAFRAICIRKNNTDTQMIDYQISPQTLLASSNLEHYVIRTVRFSTL